jgi:protein-S-isoprenylcysteine O-methyltransferase Ste14
MELAHLLPAWFFAIAVLVASYICVRCYTSPNSPPQFHRQPEKDTLMRTALGRFSFTFNRIAVVVFGPTYAYLALKHRNPDTINRSCCPNVDQVNFGAVQWTTFTTICLATIFVFGTMRIMAYRQLGRDFTYELAPPRKLITTGLYRYIRHPSYSAKVMVAIPLGLFFLRDDAAAACWLPNVAVQYRLLSLGIWGLKTIIAIRMKESRVSEEEKMMEKEFGNEWRKYTKRTKKYIPFVF